MKISFEIMTGSKIKNFTGTLSQFRKDAFSLPPYSYCFDQKTEDEYLEAYVENDLSCLICALDGNKIIGVVSGMPLTPSSVITEKAAELFNKNKLDACQFFYICEVIVLPDYRKECIGKKLLNHIEDYAKKINLFNICFLTTMDNKNIRREKIFRKKAGYKLTSMIEKYTWPTYINSNKIENREHNLVYWIKKHA